MIANLDRLYFKLRISDIQRSKTSREFGTFTKKIIAKLSRGEAPKRVNFLVPITSCTKQFDFAIAQFLELTTMAVSLEDTIRTLKELLPVDASKQSPVQATQVFLSSLHLLCELKKDQCRIQRKGYE